MSEWITHEYVLDVIAYVSSTKKGTDKFKIASTLYSLTNNGATKIDKGVVAIHKNDDIIDYIEKEDCLVLMTFFIAFAISEHDE